MAASAGQPPEDLGEVPRQEPREVTRPSSTAVSFVLLIALVALAGAVVGNWLWLGFGRGDGLDVLVPAVWLVVPPLLVLAVTAVVAGLEPQLVVRRRRLVPVPADLPGAARFAALAAEAGLRHPPRLVYHPDDDGTSARSVGRTGHHLVVVSPAILGMARRRPATFDIILRHELAHVRSGDVALATFAIRTWHVTLLVLALPLVARLWDRDLSMIPSYVVRAALLALVVYAVRAHLLREREHHADIAATPLPEDAARFGSALASLGAPPSRRRPDWLALHPTAGARAAVVADPGLLARPQPGTFLAAGFAAGAGAPVLADILDASGLSSLAANQVPYALLLGLVGAVATAEVLRAGTVGARAFLVPAIALVGGMAAGAAGSLGSTALESWLHVVAATAGVVALPVAALLLAGADAAVQRWRPDGRVLMDSSTTLTAGIVLGAVIAGLTAAVWAPWGAMVGMGSNPPVQLALESSDVLEAAAVATAFGAVLLVPRAAWREVLVTAAAGSGLVAVGQLALRAGVGAMNEPMLWLAFSDAAFALTLAVAAAAVVVATVRAGAASGVVTGALVAAGGVIVLGVLVAATGNGQEISGVSAVFARWVVLALLLGVPVTALAGVLRRPPPEARAATGPAVGVPEPGTATRGVVEPREATPAREGAWRRRGAFVAAGLLAVVLGGGAFAWGAPWVAAEGERLGETRTLYLEEDLPYLEWAWQYARTDAEIAMAMADPPTFLEASTLPAFDRALGSAELVTDRVASAEDAILSELHDALLAGITADRTYWAAVAAAAAGTGSLEDAETLGVEAGLAVERFLAARDAALAGSTETP